MILNNASRFTVLLAVPALVAIAASCGSSSSTNNSQNSNNAGGGYALTIYNQASWCYVGASVNGVQDANFADASYTINGLAAGTTVNLTATAQPGFQPPQWTGTTTTQNGNATYVMTTASNQNVTVYCP